MYQPVSEGFPDISQLRRSFQQGGGATRHIAYINLNINNIIINVKAPLSPVAVAAGARYHGGRLPHCALLPPAQRRPAAAGQVMCMYSWTASVKMS